MNSDVKFRLELIAEAYSREFDIGKKLIFLKGQEYYPKLYEKYSDETLAIIDCFKEMKQFCIKYKK